MPSLPEPPAHDNAALPTGVERSAEAADRVQAETPATGPTFGPAIEPTTGPAETSEAPAGSTPSGALAPKPLAAPWRWLLMLLACVSLATGVVGIFVPGLPTTVFVLVAAWAAARSSPRLHRWLLAHQVFGKLIADWQQGGCVSRRSKWNASAAMALCTAMLVWLGHRWWITSLAIGCMACVLVWLWCRPEPVLP